MKVGTRFTWVGDDGLEGFPKGERVVTEIDNFENVHTRRADGTHGVFAHKSGFERLLKEGKIQIVEEGKYAVKYAVKYVGRGSEMNAKNWVNSDCTSLQEKSNRQFFNTKAEAEGARADRALKMSWPKSDYRIVRITKKCKLSRAIERVEQIKAQCEASRDSAVSSKSYIIAGQYTQAISTVYEILTAIRP